MKKYNSYLLLLIGLALLTISNQLLADNKVSAFGIKKLLALKSNESTNLYLKTKSRLIKINLTKKIKNKNLKGSVIQQGAKSNAPKVNIDLYSGYIVNNRKSDTREVVHASIYKNKLKITYQSSKQKQHTANLNLSKFDNNKTSGKIEKKMFINEFGRFATLLSTNEINNKQTKTTSNGSALRLAIEVDYDFFQALGGEVDDVVAYLQETVSALSDIFENQLGITITLHDYNINTDPSHPYSHNTDDALEILQNLRAYFIANPSYLEGDFRIMLTGKDICYDDGTTCNYNLYKLNYQNTLCNESTYNLGVIDIVLPEVMYKFIAMAIASNLGAESDASSPTSLMHPDEGYLATSFSQKTVNEMLLYMNYYNNCFLDTSTNDLKIKVKLNKKNKFTISAKANNYVINHCSLKFHAASTREKLATNPTIIANSHITDHPITDNSLKFQFIFSDRRPNSDTYFQALTTCGEVETLSNIKAIKPKAGNSEARYVSPNQFIKYILRRLQ